MWQVVFAGISAGASLFNAVDEATANRAIRDKLENVIGYLQELDAKLELVQSQNMTILQQLDELPRVIRAIVQEIVDDALLEERYAAMHTIKLNIITLRLDKNYRITKSGWFDLSNALTYLFLHENRISHLFKLLLGCELALAATRNQAQPFITRLLTDKIALLNALCAAYVERIDVLELQPLKSLLDNKQYIRTHNLSDQLDRFDTLRFENQPDQTRTVTYTERVCVMRKGSGKLSEPYEVCTDTWRSREEPDTPFHTARDNHVALVNQKVAVITAMLRDVANLSGVIKRFESYLTGVNGQALTIENVVLFHAVSPELLRTDGQAPATEQEVKAYNYYYDDVPVSSPAQAAPDKVSIAGAFELVNWSRSRSPAR